MWCKTGVLLKYKQWVRIPINVGIKLRKEVTLAKNIEKMMKDDNKSGTNGVHFHKASNKWRAGIVKNYKLISLGNFAEKQEAIDARKKAEKKYYGEFSPTTTKETS